MRSLTAALSLLCSAAVVSAPTCLGTATAVIPDCAFTQAGCPAGCEERAASESTDVTCTGTANPVTPQCELPDCAAGCTFLQDAILSAEDLESADCAGNWSSWGGCSVLCGGGERSRVYAVSNAGRSGGSVCTDADAAVERQACNEHSCPATCTGNATAFVPACAFRLAGSGASTCPAGCLESAAVTPPCAFTDGVTSGLPRRLSCPGGCAYTPIALEEVTPPVCRGNASEVTATCTGSAIVPRSGESLTCDLDASTDGTDSCPGGCTFVAPFTPLCAFTDGISPPVGCPVGCVLTPEVTTQLPSATCIGQADEVEASCTGVAETGVPTCDLLCDDGSEACVDGSNNCPAGCTYTGHFVGDTGDCDIDGESLTPQQLAKKAECEALLAADAALDCLDGDCGIALAIASVVCLSVVLASCLPQGRPKASSIRAADLAMQVAVANAERESDPDVQAAALADAKRLADRWAWWKLAAWYLLFPLVCLGHSVDIFVKPCILSYALGALGKACLWFGRNICCCFNCRCCRRSSYCICFMYKDSEFPADSKSIGPIGGSKSDKQIEDMFDWVSALDICAGIDESIEIQPDGSVSGSSMRLFQGEIQPEDVAQGQLGDCWLLTAIACLAEFPGAIQSVFVTQEYNARGRYVVRLYNARTKRFEEIIIDDQIPTLEGTREPAFAKPHGKELWVTLLEKAFAKFVGSYAALDGGFTLWGLQTLTGDEVSNFALDVQTKGELHWGEYEIRADPDEPDNKLAINFYKRKRNRAHLVHTRDAFYKKLEQWDLQACVMAASTEGDDGGVETAQQGLVQGHAYAIVSVVEVTQIMKPSRKMLRLRNPWGSFEWTGPWGDSHPNWTQFPHVQTKCSEYEDPMPDGSPGQAGFDSDDGMFWMEYCDFMDHFSTVDVCHRSTGIADVKIDLYEDDGCLGPTKGCAKGCCEFYLPHCSKQAPHCRGCIGCTALCCPSVHNKHGADYGTLDGMENGNVELPSIEIVR